VGGTKSWTRPCLEEKATDAALAKAVVNVEAEAAL
jgi:hypothetical protein